MSTPLVALWTHPTTKLCASIILALTWWIALRLSYTYNVTVSLHVQPATEHISQFIVPETVPVTLSGAWEDLYNFIISNPALHLSPSLLKRGLQELVIMPQHLNLPNNLRLSKSASIPIFFNPTL